MIKDPPWLAIARKYEGIKEVPGIKSAPFIVQLWDSLPWMWKLYPDDSILAWCGAFIRWCLVFVGIKPPKEWYRAKAFINFGTRIFHPAYGAIGVVKNSKGKYHVGFVVGRNTQGDIMLLGGNQNDMVRVSAFKFQSFVAFVWPNYEYKDIPLAGTLPILDADFSASEA